MRGWILVLGLLGAAAPARAMPAINPFFIEQALNRGVVADLQTFGIPASVFHYESPDERLTSIYQLNPSSPTLVGVRLHATLRKLTEEERARLRAQLARNDFARLGKALAMLNNIEVLKRNGQLEAYPEDDAAYMDKALEILRGPPLMGPPGPEPPAPPSVRPVLVEHRESLEKMRSVLGKAADVLPAFLGPALRGQAERLAEGVESIDVLAGAPNGHLTSRGLLTIVQTLPEDRLEKAQWKALVSAFPNGDSINRLEVLELWRRGITGRGVKIGVVDDGVDATHPDLKGIRAPDDRNYTHERHLNGPRVGKPDNRGDHGTHVAGTIRSLAPEAEIISYKTNERDSNGIPPNRRLGEAQRIQAGADALACAGRDGCRIVSTSVNWGGRGQPNSPDAVSKAVAGLHEDGVIVMKSAGNSGRGSGSAPSYSPHVVTVGAVTYTDRDATFTSRDVYVEDGKDGRTRVREKPDVLSYGASVRSAQFDPKGEYDKDPRKDYVRWDGTSMATPTAAASVALIQQRARELGLTLTPEEQARLLRATGTPRRGDDDPEGPRIVLPGAACRRLEECAKAGRRP